MPDESALIGIATVLVVGAASPGPSFVMVGSDPSLASSYQIAGVNTFSEGKHGARFRSEGGGMSVPAYASWIVSIVGD